jgi:hypothetical protein
MPSVEELLSSSKELHLLTLKLFSNFLFGEVIHPSQGLCGLTGMHLAFDATG